MLKNLYSHSSVGGSIVTGDEDISPYATFHLLGMREENKNGMMNPQAYKTMPSQAQVMGGGPMPMPQTGPNTPAHSRHVSQTMNVSCRLYLCRVLKLTYSLLAAPKKPRQSWRPRTHAADSATAASRLRCTQLRLRSSQLHGSELWKPLRLPRRNVQRLYDV